MRHTGQGTISITDIGRDPAMNARFNEPSVKDLMPLIASMVLEGYKANLGVPTVIRNDPRVDSAFDWLVNFRESLTKRPQQEDMVFDIGGKIGKVHMSSVEMVAAFDTIYKKNGKSEKLIKPGCVITTCFGRTLALIYANMVNWKLGDRELIRELPVLECAFDDEAERIQYCLDENLKHNLGRRGMSQNDLITGAKQLFDKMVIEIRFRETFGPGTGQKLFRLCRFDREFPHVGVLTRCLQKPELYPSLDKEKLYNLCEARVRASTDADRKIADDEALAYVSDPNLIGENKKKIAPRKEIEAIANQSKLAPFNVVGSAVIANDIGRLNRYNGYAELVNKIWNLIYSGSPEQVKALSEFVDTLK